MNNKRIGAIHQIGSTGPCWATAIEFLDGTNLPPPGSLANHATAELISSAPLPTGAAAYSILRDSGAPKGRHTDELLAEPGYYAKKIRQLWETLEGETPGHWRIVYTRTWGVHGTLDSNKHLVREAQLSEAHAVLVQPEEDATAEIVIDRVHTLRKWQNQNPPKNGHFVDILAHVSYSGPDDNKHVEKVANAFPLFFLDVHGTNSAVVEGLSQLHKILRLKKEKPWIGGTQVGDFTTGPGPMLAAPLLNALGLAACVQRLGGRIPGGDEGIDVVNKKLWPFPGSNRGVPRSNLPAGTKSKAPQSPGHDITSDQALAGNDGAFDLHRTHVFIEAVEIARTLYADLTAGRIESHFFTRHPEIKATLQ